jgi:hypothetical protein
VLFARDEGRLVAKFIGRAANGSKDSAGLHASPQMISRTTHGSVAPRGKKKSPPDLPRDGLGLAANEATLGERLQVAGPESVDGRAGRLGGHRNR